MRRYLLFMFSCYIALLLLGMALGSLMQHRRSLVTFDVKIPQGSVVKIFADQGGDAPFQYDPAKPLFTLHKSQEVKTKTGVYDFVVEPDTDYKTNVSKVTVNKSTGSVNISPDYSDKRLDSLLTENKSAIIASVFSSFPDAPKYYSANKVQLFKHGEWAGLTLTPTSEQYDPVRFVLHEKNGQWGVVNEPSVFVLGSLYESVPADVTAAVNSL